MRQEQYLKLEKPKKVSPSNDPEGPTVDSPVLKILNFSGLDEHHDSAFIQFVYQYGFVNSKKEFKALESLVYPEYVVDIEPIIEDGKKLDVGTNKISRQKERAGNWLSDLLEIKPTQTGRRFGDFRTEDLYNHLMNKFEIKGEILSIR